MFQSSLFPVTCAYYKCPGQATEKWTIHPSIGSSVVSYCPGCYEEMKGLNAFDHCKRCHICGQLDDGTFGHCPCSATECHACFNRFDRFRPSFRPMQCLACARRSGLGMKHRYQLVRVRFDRANNISDYESEEGWQREPNPEPDPPKAAPPSPEEGYHSLLDALAARTDFRDIVEALNQRLAFLDNPKQPESPSSSSSCNSSLEANNQVRQEERQAGPEPDPSVAAVMQVMIESLEAHEEEDRPPASPSYSPTSPKYSPSSPTYSCSSIDTPEIHQQDPPRLPDPVDLSHVKANIGLAPSTRVDKDHCFKCRLVHGEGALVPHPIYGPEIRFHAECCERFPTSPVSPCSICGRQVLSKTEDPNDLRTCNVSGCGTIECSDCVWIARATEHHMNRKESWNLVQTVLTKKGVEESQFECLAHWTGTSRKRKSKEEEDQRLFKKRQQLSTPLLTCVRCGVRAIKVKHPGLRGVGYCSECLSDLKNKNGVDLNSAVAWVGEQEPGDPKPITKFCSICWLGGDVNAPDEPCGILSKDLVTRKHQFVCGTPNCPNKECWHCVRQRRPKLAEELLRNPDIEFFCYECSLVSHSILFQ